jgi:anti-sigma regulatory factor (Ser/Thr protein kinase)
MQPRAEFPGPCAGDQARGGLGSGFAPVPGTWLDRPEPGHVAFFYDSRDEYADVTGAFVRAGLDGGDPVMVAVPAANTEVIREHVRARAGPGQMPVFEDMAVLGRNPARIIAAILTFADQHPGQLLHYVGEPAWPSRTRSEHAEVARHEQLLNAAFGRERVRILCPYDATGLEREVLAQAAGTHPVLMRNGHVERSPAPSDRAGTVNAAAPLPSPPADVPILTYRDDPGAARQFARQRARAAGLTEPRLTDLVIAVGELAANTLRHTRSDGTIAVWADAGEVICEVRDHGHIRDATAGRRTPPADAIGGHGLWVVHQVCDRVEMRTGSSGTVFRLHMGLAG